VSTTAARPYIDLNPPMRAVTKVALDYEEMPWGEDVIPAGVEVDVLAIDQVDAYICHKHNRVVVARAWLHEQRPDLPPSWPFV